MLVVHALRAITRSTLEQLLGRGAARARSLYAKAYRLKTAVAGTQTPVGPLTVSVGAAPLRPGQDLARLLADADLGLMEAKRQGRNRVCVPTDVQPPANLRQ